MGVCTQSAREKFMQINFLNLAGYDEGIRTARDAVWLAVGCWLCELI